MNKTTIEFITELKQMPKHINSKTDKANYINSKTKIEIGCENDNHGYYFATPNSLLSGSGCPKCAGHNKTTDEFISELKIVPRHINSKIDRAIYINSTTKIEVGCENEDHGYYFALPIDLLKGAACPKCARRTKKTTNKYISELKQMPKHINSKTDRINYIDSQTKIEVGCENNNHGYYFSFPGHLLSGSGCPKCSGRNKTTEEFIVELKQDERHINSKTDRANYINSTTKIEIGCEKDEHGYYFCLPRDLLKNSGCPKCALKKKLKTTEEFISELKIVPRHINTKTNRTVYIDSKTKLEVGCHIDSHGYYFTRPDTLLKGGGCPKCSNRNYESTKPGILYYIKISKGIHTSYKIGITNATIKKRFVGEMKYITVLREIHFPNGEHALNEENRIKNQYKEHRWTGPQLLRSGHTEMFNIDILGLDN